jgi:hypothetical protein
MSVEQEQPMRDPEEEEDEDFEDEEFEDEEFEEGDDEEIFIEDGEEEEFIDMGSLLGSVLTTENGDTVCSALVSISNQIEMQNRIMIKILAQLQKKA